MSIKSWNEKRRIRKLFGKYIDEKVIENFLSNDAIIPIPKAETIELLLLKIKYAGLPELNEKIEKIGEIIKAHNGIVMEMISNIVVGTNWKTDGFDAHSVASEVYSTLTSEVSIIYGKIQGYRCNVGTEGRMAYTIVNPEMPEYFGKLSKLNWGNLESLNTAE